MTTPADIVARLDALETQFSQRLAALEARLDKIADTLGDPADKRAPTPPRQLLVYVDPSAPARGFRDALFAWDPRARAAAQPLISVLAMNARQFCDMLYAHHPEVKQHYEGLHRSLNAGQRALEIYWALVKHSVTVETVVRALGSSLVGPALDLRDSYMSFALANPFLA
jgi:hypothetical protein